MKEKPNILVIMTDQQRGDALGISGHPTVLTPNLDYLAAQGARFERTYSNCPMCIPARRSFLSGQFPSSHGMLANKEACQWHPKATLPGELRKAGYHTQIVGRGMHQYPTRKRFGFDNMTLTGDVHPDDIYETIPGAHGVAPSWSHGLHANGWTARPWHLEEDIHPSNRTADEAIRFFQRRDPDCPFFLVASFAGPHPPLYPPAFYMDRYLRMDNPPTAIGDWAKRPEDDGKGLFMAGANCCLEGEALLSCQAGYFGMINHIDDQICRMLAPFTGLDDETAQNTIIVFTSDHGEMLGDHYQFRKSRPYEGSARVPLIVYAPEHFGLAKGKVIHEAATLADIMPTLLDLAGVDIPDSVDGQSLAPLLKKEPADWKRPFIHAEHAEIEPDLGWHMLSDGKLKYIWLSQSGEEQLFDLTTDPQELRDLSKDPSYGEELLKWRDHLVSTLSDRPEKFTDGAKLIAGRPHQATMEHASQTL